MSTKKDEAPGIVAPIAGMGAASSCSGIGYAGCGQATSPMRGMFDPSDAHNIY